MRTLTTGEPCPCCGEPIPMKDPLELLWLTCTCVLLGLLPADYLESDEE